MSDGFIDYLECGDYSDHTVRELGKLVGADPLVDVTKVLALLQEAVATVDRELGAVGVTRSGLRATRGDVGQTVPKALSVTTRFHAHLSSLDPEEHTFDFDAFFPGRVLGDLRDLKPADLVGRMEAILRGFETPDNARLPDGAAWKKRLTTALVDLQGSVAGRDGSSGTSIRSTVGLQAARSGFVRTYNGVAKNTIRGLLTLLGREDELRLFFKDLQVDERPSPAEPALPPTV